MGWKMTLSSINICKWDANVQEDQHYERSNEHAVLHPDLYSVTTDTTVATGTTVTMETTVAMETTFFHWNSYYYYCK